MNLLVLALAATVSAAGYDYEAEGFWAKHYEIPLSYCRSDIALEVADVESAKRTVPGCAFDPASSGDPESAFSYCRIAAKEFDKVLGSVLPAGRLAFFRRECANAASYPELGYKRDQIKKESAEIGLSSSTLPGISGLVAAELQVLGILIDAQDRASRPALAILFLRAAPGRAEEMAALMKSRLESTPERVKEDQARFDGFNPWRRGLYPACDQVPSIRVRYNAPSGSAQYRSIEKAVRGLGEPFDDPECLRCRGGTFAVLTHLPVKELIRKMSALDGLESWSRVGQLRHAAAVLDDKRLEILSGELASGASDLARAPHIRALAKAEIDLVRPNAEKMRRARTGTLVIVTMKHD